LPWFFPTSVVSYFLRIRRAKSHLDKCLRRVIFVKTAEDPDFIELCTLPGLDGIGVAIYSWSCSKGKISPSIYNKNIFNVHSMGHQKLKPHKEDFKLITETQQWAAHNNIDKKGKLFVWRTLIKSKAKYACGHKWWIPVRG